MNTRYAGIAWTDSGYRIEVVDDAGRQVTEPRRWHPARVAELIDWLRLLADGPVPLVILDSTNGLLDGPMTAADLPVYRADPWQLPPRPDFGSVPAARLAERGRTALGTLTRITPDRGTLTGREPEYYDNSLRSAPIRAAMAAAGRCFEHGPRDTPRVALTFDDGPDPAHTRRILDVLERYGARATFFCVGLHVAAMPDEVRRIADGGHELGNHSWSHPFLPDLTRDQLHEQLDRTTEAIARVAGRAPTRFRPPYGSLSPEVLAALADHPSALTMWDVDSRDWTKPGPEQLTANVLDAAAPGSVVLMHDGAGDRHQTVEALPAVIEGLLARGLALVPVDELGGP
ncbi:polysaccharide deacetylase family protein [Kitasatospora viridis]|uniref:Peptidoglycan/xylan/chitin deacetylase (PgdA/CDA1 family) n=1 Tax=Kitasatospora viridis TaxID=281105 RepID=A0A561UHS8_9ACTN|nr:polysaccharide deacetylase family protein [Kitasatospora viridis]TWF98921.1 peptidoglycan/xylan/chitin deacetylase (PgdA/CDA1 family) [Kitasatospora viridis]